MKELKDSVESLVPRGVQIQPVFHYPHSRLWFGSQTLEVCYWLSLHLEFLFVQQEFAMGLGFLIAGVIVALFPSNYEIRGMEEESS